MPLTPIVTVNCFATAQSVAHQCDVPMERVNRIVDPLAHDSRRMSCQRFRVNENDVEEGCHRDRIVDQVAQ